MTLVKGVLPLPPSPCTKEYSSYTHQPQVGGVKVMVLSKHQRVLPVQTEGSALRCVALPPGSCRGGRTEFEDKAEWNRCASNEVYEEKHGSIPDLRE